MNTPRSEKTIKELFIGECWSYLHNNFHKFSEPNKIKIALTLAQKDLPQEIQGMQQNIIISATIQKEVSGELENTNRVAEYFKRGSPAPAPTA